eukprot:gnl/TRDRNA2_/TRDRNA2_78963_c0_seq1.p1 gnl/TRDRNA2_/TRDRNA2_78963_c0~~gnl/TRDRNA2_/TRDRNA2_78963_c0_seq1.p1  ORF type:complete len:158 (-),score=22.07 gnl/TRDRNA2_/TRDRNA2_78963_c0_seq1:99-572(-)
MIGMLKEDCGINSKGQCMALRTGPSTVGVGTWQELTGDGGWVDSAGTLTYGVKDGVVDVVECFIKSNGNASEVWLPQDDYSSMVHMLDTSDLAGSSMASELMPILVGLVVLFTPLILGVMIVCMFSRSRMPQELLQVNLQNDIAEDGVSSSGYQHLR